MPALPTYTASGQTRQGAVADAPSIAAAVAPYNAVANAGQALAGLGSEVAGLAAQRGAVEAQKKKEDELAWATETAARYERVLAERRAEDARNPRETEGAEFRDFADATLEEYQALAPSTRAAQLFRRHGLNAANNGYEYALKSGEHTRLTNADASNSQSVADLVSSFKATESVIGPQIAAATITPLVKLQLASIEERFGKTAPAFASKLRMNVVEEIAVATAATNPDYARSVVNNAPITEESKGILHNKIDSIQSSATALERFRFTEGLKESLKVAAIDLNPVPPPDPSKFKALFGKAWQTAYEGFEADRKAANTAHALLRGIGDGSNPFEQAKKIDSIANTGTPDEKLAIPAMMHAQKASAVLAAKDPVAWQVQHDPDVQNVFSVIDSLPDAAKPAARAAAAYKQLARQGHAPAGDPYPERYLGLDRTHLLSVAEADRRKVEINSATPDKKLSLLADLEAEFGDPVLANKAYSDMLELGDEKLSVAFRFTGIINNVQTKKEFVDAQTNAKDLDKLDETKKREYLDVLDSPGGDWQKFSSGWLGESMEGSTDNEDSKGALLAYAQSLTVKHRMSPKDAMKTAVQRVISDNYGFAEVHGHVIPIGRKRLFGGIDRSDAEIKDISRRLAVALKEVPVREIALSNPQTGTPYFPTIQPSADMSKPENAQIVRDIVTSTGFWEMDATGEMLTLKVAEPGRTGFSVIDKSNMPLTIKLDDLPTYTTSLPAFNAVGGRAYIAEQPQGTYPIVTGKSWWTDLGFNQEAVKTNWPTRPSWMRDPMGRNFRLEDEGFGPPILTPSPAPAPPPTPGPVVPTHSRPLWEMLFPPNPYR